MVSCRKGPTRHAYAWQIGPFWQDALELSHHVLHTHWRCFKLSPQSPFPPLDPVIHRNLNLNLKKQNKTKNTKKQTNKNNTFEKICQTHPLSATSVNLTPLTRLAAISMSTTTETASRRVVTDFPRLQTLTLQLTSWSPQPGFTHWQGNTRSRWYSCIGVPTARLHTLTRQYKKQMIQWDWCFHSPASHTDKAIQEANDTVALMSQQPGITHWQGNTRSRWYSGIDVPTARLHTLTRQYK